MIRAISLIIIIISSVPCFRATSITQPTGKIIGTVMDLNEAVVPGVKILVRSGNIDRHTISNEEGSYQFDLPEGIYTLTADCDPCWFRPFRRAVFHVQPNNTLMLNIVLRGNASHVANPPIYYDTFTLNDVSNPTMKLEVEYFRKWSDKRFIHYRSGRVSYNALTVIAQRVWLDKKTKQLEFKSDWRVIIEDGKKRVYAKVARVKFKKGTPEVEIIK